MTILEFENKYGKREDIKITSMVKHEGEWCLNVICLCCGETREKWRQFRYKNGRHFCKKKISEKNKANAKLSSPPRCEHHKTTEQFIMDAIKIHGDKYKYNKSVYKNAQSSLIITCPIHGDFEQEATNHLSGYGCKKCANEKRKYTQKEAILKLNVVHGDKYKYGKYKSFHESIDIFCPIHGKFEQRYSSHLDGSGCSRCNMSKPELKILKFLNKHSIHHIMEHTFSDLPKKRYDFYLPDYNLCIEYDGEHHFVPNPRYGMKSFIQIKENDKIKTNYCIKNGVELLRIPFTEYNNINKILKRRLGCST